MLLASSFRHRNNLKTMKELKTKLSNITMKLTYRNNSLSGTHHLVFHVLYHTSLMTIRLESRICTYGWLNKGSELSSINEMVLSLTMTSFSHQFQPLHLAEVLQQDLSYGDHTVTFNSLMGT